MNCITAGIIGISMLTATFFTMTVTNEQHDKLRRVLSPELERIYERIVNERRNLYFQGLILGLIVSYFILQSYATQNTFHRVTFYMAITLTVSVLYYFLMPKSDYMLNHLKSPVENKAWLDVYRTMKNRYFLGMLFGTLSAIPIAYALC